MIAELPLWAAVLVAVLVVGGAFVTMLGQFGLLRAPTFYSRAHPPTLGNSLGMSGVLFASLVYFSVSGGRTSIHELIFVILIPVVSPVTMMLLARAALFRDRRMRRDEQERFERATRVAAELARAEEEAARHPEPPGEDPPS